MSGPIIQRTINTGAGAAFALSEIPGYQQGFIPKYDTTTSIKITPGNYEVDGDLFSLAADATHTMTGLISAFGHQYIYLDKSASTPTVPAFYDEDNTVNEPVESIARNGWYHPVDTEDRLVAYALTKNGIAQIFAFNAVEEKGHIVSTFGVVDTPRIALNMNPDGLWQTPNDSDGSVMTPVSADKIMIRMRGRKTSALATIAATTKERGAVSTNIASGELNLLGFDEVYANAWLNLGESRDILVGGAGADGNNLSALLMGSRWGR